MRALPGWNWRPELEIRADDVLLATDDRFGVADPCGRNNDRLSLQPRLGESFAAERPRVTAAFMWYWRLPLFIPFAPEELLDLARRQRRELCTLVGSAE